jgi:hypothetical protein
MDAFGGFLPLLAIIVFGCVLAAGLVAFWWTNRTRNMARLEMKRHVQKEEVRRSV